MVNINNFLNILSPFFNRFETFKLTLQADILGYSLAICTIVGTVAIFLKILGFNTGKWALLVGSAFLFIIIILG